MSWAATPANDEALSDMHEHPEPDRSNNMPVEDPGGGHAALGMAGQAPSGRDFQHNRLFPGGPLEHLSAHVTSIHGAASEDPWTFLAILILLPALMLYLLMALTLGASLSFIAYLCREEP